MDFQEQNTLLLESYIQNYAIKKPLVEFIFSSECDQRCEYCYLQKHAEEMNYPRANNKEQILHNLKLFLDYLEENHFKFNNYDIYSGEFFNLPYWSEILDVFYEHHKNLDPKPLRDIVIPTNGSFIASAEKTALIEEYIEKFEKIECSLYLSLSIDGPEHHDNKARPNINQDVVKDEDFYNRVFEFASKHDYCFHPMIGKIFLENYKENYDWFIDNTTKHDLRFVYQDGSYSLNVPMMLEIRDSEQWDEESLKNYKKFLWYVFETDLKKIYDNDLKSFAHHIFDDNTVIFKTIIDDSSRNQPYILAYPAREGTKVSCSIQNAFICRIGDLTLAPCHRLYYSQFEYGKFITNEDNTKIIGVEGKNPTLAFKIATFNPVRSNLKCGACKYKPFCVDGCFGSQYEHTHEIFGCQDQVCEMFKVKYQTIHEICETRGLYDLILNDPYVPTERKEYITYARNILSSE